MIRGIAWRKIAFSVGVGGAGFVAADAAGQLS
jgi:hypothetical protein